MVKGAVVVLLLLLAGVARADPASELWSFARQAQGKFVSELPVLPTALTLEVAVREYIIGSGTYDHAAAKFVVSFPQRLQQLKVQEKCTKAGLATGANAFGAKVSFERLKCDSLNIDAEDRAFPMGDLDCTFIDRMWSERSQEERAARCAEHGDRRLELPMTPSQYREFKQRGLLMVVDFAPAAGASQEVAVARPFIDRATLDSRIETRGTAWDVRGTIKSVALLRASNRELVARYPASQ